VFAGSAVVGRAGPATLVLHWEQRWGISWGPGKPPAADIKEDIL